MENDDLRWTRVETQLGRVRCPKLTSMSTFSETKQNHPQRGND